MHKSTFILAALISNLMLNPAISQAKDHSSLLPLPNSQDRRHDNRQDRRQDVRQTTRQVKRVINRSRHFRNVIILRPHGHLLTGYGFYHNDNDAYKWLAFTAITLKILDNINEDAQRKHEAAQVKATTARVGDKIFWSTNDASGYVVTTKVGKNIDGRTCREFQQSIKVGGNIENAYGTACLQPDGAWKII